jgi:hypothetical protein
MRPSGMAVSMCELRPRGSRCPTPRKESEQCSPGKSTQTQQPCRPPRIARKTAPPILLPRPCVNSLVIRQSERKGCRNGCVHCHRSDQPRRNRFGQVAVMSPANACSAPTCPTLPDDLGLWRLAWGRRHTWSLSRTACTDRFRHFWSGVHDRRCERWLGEFICLLWLDYKPGRRGPKNLDQQKSPAVDRAL